MKKKDEDLSMTFIDEVGQKSAVIDKEELKNGKYKAEVKEKKGGKKPLLIIYALIIIFPFILGIYSAQYIPIKEIKKEKKKVITVKKEKKEEEISPDTLLLEELINKYDNYDYSIFKELYSDKITIESMDKDYREGLIFNSFLNRKTVSKEEVDNKITLLFSDKYIEIEDEYSSDCVSAKYEDGEYSIERKDCKDKKENTIERKIVKAVKKKDNSIEVNVAVAMIIDEKVYKGYNKDDELIELEDISSKKFNIEKDYTKLNQYKYVFKYDTDNMIYYLDYIKEVK